MEYAASSTYKTASDTRATLLWTDRCKDSESSRDSVHGNHKNRVPLCGMRDTGGLTCSEPPLSSVRQGVGISKHDDTQNQWLEGQGVLEELLDSSKTKTVYARRCTPTLRGEAGDPCEQDLMIRGSRGIHGEDLHRNLLTPERSAKWRTKKEFFGKSAMPR